MSLIFLSHSSKDDFETITIGDWLAENGWDDVFLDLDPVEGISPGERWQRALYEHAARCEAVLFLVSRSWLASDWCRREYELAHKLNKRIFVALIDSLTISELPDYLKETHQAVALGLGADHRIFRPVMPITQKEGYVTFSKEGLARLKAGLTKAGLDPRFFAWPPENEPERAPYRGLSPLEEEDAGVFFGRDAPVIEALDALRGLSEAAPPRLFVLLGASGAGKSSFLHAGLLPRLERDDQHFLPLPVIRPERAALTGDRGFVAALAAACVKRGLAATRAQIREAMEGSAQGLRSILAKLAGETTLVVSIDQAEELFRAEGMAEGEGLLVRLRDLTAQDVPKIIALFSIRSDSYDALEHAKPLDGLRQHTFALLPIPRGAYQTVIEGPALRLVKAGRAFEIEPALTEKLLEDIEIGGGADALPLLSFTLEQLYREHEAAKRITREDYNRFGELKGAIDATMARVFAAADTDPRIPKDQEARLKLLRRGLIPWLAGIDPETKTPRRRRAPAAQIPQEARPLIDLLVEQRLLTRDIDEKSHEPTMEPAHESLLRQWASLKGWLAEDFGRLATLEGVKRAAIDWDANKREPSWLAHSGARLEEADRLDARPDLAAMLDGTDRAYLVTCRQKEKAAREAEEARARVEADLERQKTQNLEERARNSRRLSAVLLIAFVVALAFAGLAGSQWYSATKAKLEAQAQRDEARKKESLFLAKSAREELRAGNSVTSMQLALRGLPVDKESEKRPLVAETLGSLIEAINGNEPILRHDNEVKSAEFSLDGQRVITGSSDGTSRLWDVASGREIRTFSDNLTALSPDGHLGLAASNDGGARLWDLTTGKVMANLKGHVNRILSAVFSPDGKQVLTASSDKTARIWDLSNPRLSKILVGHTDIVTFARFSPNGVRAVTTSLDGTTRLWDATTGREVAVLVGHTGGVLSAAFSSDGTHVVTASDDSTARVWDSATGQEIAVLRHKGSVLSAAFSNDGARVVTASEDKTAGLWDATTGRLIAVLQGNEGEVDFATFSPESERVVTASKDRTARLWDAKTGNELAVLRVHDGPVNSATFSPDGFFVVTASDDKTARIMLVGNSVDRIIETAREKLPGEMSPEQERKFYLTTRPSSP